ncbi:hypothetical protein E4T56_gene11785 [Termitomyces sp. T112]|nr:hypothetical protein E4T56_gene11785 [Termitomyces sp. T112]
MQTLTPEPPPSSPRPLKVHCSSTSSLHLNVEIETMDTQQTCGVMALLDSRAIGLFLDSGFVKCHGLTTQPLPKPIPVYNIDGMPNKAGTINSVVDLVLCYQNYVEHTMFAVPSLDRQDMILGFMWLCKHNPEVDWTKGQITMSRCPWKCFICAAEDRAEHQAQVQEHAAICACHASLLPFADLDLLDPLPLAFPYRKAFYKDNQSGGGASGKEHGREFDGVHELEFLDKAVEVGDWIYTTTVHPPPSIAEIWASQTISQQLAQAFAANAMPESSRTWYLPTSIPVLLFPDDNSLFWVEADSSNFATGAVLLQQSPKDGKWHLVAFYSESLNAVEQNYEIHDKEMLAIIWSFEEWQHFLEGAWHKFKVWTDHKNLEYFQTAKKLNCQQAQWSLSLANFDFSLHYKPGWSIISFLQFCA